MAKRYKAVLAGALAATLCLAAAWWSSSRQVSFRRDELARDTRIVASQSAGKIWSALERHRVALQQVANFFQNRTGVTEEEFYSFAGGTHVMTPLFIRISFVDPSWHIRWIHPLDPNRDFIGFDVRTHRRGADTLFRAMELREAVLSPPIPLLDGATGFILGVPIFRRDRFLGEVVGTVRASDFFEASITPETTARYDIRVLSNDSPLLTRGTFASGVNSLPLVSQEFMLGGNVWQIRMKPRDEVVQRSLRSGQAAFWILAYLLALVAGCLAAMGVSWASSTARRLESQGAALQETRTKLEGAMRQLLQAEKMTALGELVAGVAHEINNPIASIMGYSQLLLAKELPPEVKRRLEIVYAESERMAKIVRNLLTFARKQPPEKKYLGLNGILDKTLELKAYHFRSSQIEIERNLAQDLPMTMLDFHQMQQVLLNLFNNAEHAMAEKGKGGKIRIVTRVEGDRIHLRITDSGPGVPPDIQSRIFEPFFTTKKEGKGTGLGLSLCYGIVQEHGGAIRVEGPPGEGATFLVDLPIVQPTPAAGKPAPTVTPGSSRGLNVLVVENEENVMNLLVEVLTARGHRVDTASDVPEALQKIAANGHDLIISDVKLRRGSGREIYQAVAEKNPGLARRIVFTAGGGDSGDAERFVRDRGNEILFKPFRIEEIERAIASALRN